MKATYIEGAPPDVALLPFWPFWGLVAGLMAVAYNTLRFVVLGA
jgi:hypothetical protein